MNHKEIETTTRNPSVGADEGQPSKTYTPISAETADRLHSDLSSKPRRATVATIATVILGAVVLSSHRRGGKKAVAGGLLKHEKIKFEAVA